MSSIAQCCWTSLGGGVVWEVYALDARPGRDQQGLWVGGSIMDAGGLLVDNVALWDGTTWVPLSGPSNTGTDGDVWLVREVEGSLYAGGEFSTAGGVTANHVARWDGTRWWPMSGPTAIGADDVVAVLRGNNGLLYAGGGFTSAGGTVANHVARWDGS